MNYQAIVIGAGMSGLAAAIRLAMFGKKVVILEAHFAPGGLNSYYARGNRAFDVGLHAMTNFIDKSAKGRPLNKLLKQLRIPYEMLELEQQVQSRIHFDQHQLKFSNNIEQLLDEITLKFPDQIDGFNQLLQFIDQFNETDLHSSFTFARPIISKYITNEELLEMIYCPLLIYGSATAHDMDLSQFVIMFKSIYLEGFCRPRGGVRKIIDLLIHRAAHYGVEIRYRAKVSKIISIDQTFKEVELENGERVAAEQLYSSAGIPETLELLTSKSQLVDEVGEMSFCEAILCLPPAATKGIDDTIVFYNKGSKYHYQKPLDFYDSRSAVICFPTHFKKAHPHTDEDMVRFTFMANFELWEKLKKVSKNDYQQKKDELLISGVTLLKELYPAHSFKPTFHDVFTPITVKRYTGHFSGTIYGSPKKCRSGKTDINNLFIIGTDQGFLGIVGAILSGISMANLHGLTSGLQHEI